MKKTVVELRDENRKHYKTITIHRSPLGVWKALVQGSFSVLGIDLKALRSQRKRKGGK